MIFNAQEFIWKRSLIWSRIGLFFIWDAYRDTVISSKATSEEKTWISLDSIVIESIKINFCSILSKISEVFFGLPCSVSSSLTFRISLLTCAYETLVKDASIAFSSAAPSNNQGRLILMGLSSKSTSLCAYPSTYLTWHLCRSRSSNSPSGVPETTRPHRKQVICHIVPPLSNSVLKAEDFVWQWRQFTLSNDRSIPKPSW